MAKKTVCLVTLLSFILFNFSCIVHTTRKEPVGFVKGEPDVQILGVVKTSGEYIEFPKKTPARIYGDQIVGTAFAGKQVQINRSDIQKMTIQSGTPTELILKDGKHFFISAVVSEDQDKIVFISGSVSIPLSEVEMVWVRRVDQGMSLLATVGGIAGTLLAVFGIIALTKESCPFIYSYDGARYIFDAEPYGGATCQGLKRTEWCRLEHLKEVNGRYRILLKNEVDETQYTDELKLAVIDHPRGTKIVPDEAGKMHTIAHPLVPVRAYDGKGRNILPLVTQNDWLFWQTRTEEKDPESSKGLKDELVFEFPKPEGARQAKLIFNGCNTLWGSQMLKRSLELYGNKVQDWYAEVNAHGPAFYRMNLWNTREELYRLQIRVETPDGWKSKGAVVGGGPFVSEDKAYILDLGDLRGDTLRIKLTPPATFWMINYVAVDYTEDLPVQPAEISPLKATDRSGTDIRELMLSTDDSYLVMPHIGDTAEFVFLAPALRAGLERSIFAKASGYYDIHLQATGEPRWDILNRFGSEPGFTIRYALKEYLKWRQENPSSAQVK